MCTSPAIAPSSIEELRDILMRERQERVESQRTIGAELLKQQESIGQLTSHVDQVLEELRADLQQLRNDVLVRGDDLGRVAALQDRHSAAIEKIHATLQQLHEHCNSASGAAIPNCAGTGASADATNDENDESEGPPCGTGDGLTGTQGLEEDEDGLLDKALADEVHRLIEPQLSEQWTECMSIISDVERRITDDWTGLRGWVDAAVVAVVNRISSLECSLKSQMAERSEKMQELSDTVAKNSEQVRHFRAEVDKLAFEARLNARSLGRTAVRCALGETEGGDGDMSDLLDGASDVRPPTDSATIVFGSGTLCRDSGSGAIGTPVSVGNAHPPPIPMVVAVNGNPIPQCSSTALPRAQSFGSVTAGHAASMSVPVATSTPPRTAGKWYRAPMKTPQGYPSHSFVAAPPQKAPAAVVARQNISPPRNFGGSLQLAPTTSKGTSMDPPRRIAGVVVRGASPQRFATAPIMSSLPGTPRTATGHIQLRRS